MDEFDCLFLITFYLQPAIRSTQTHGAEGAKFPRRDIRELTRWQGPGPQTKRPSSSMPKTGPTIWEAQDQPQGVTEALAPSRPGGKPRAGRGCSPGARGRPGLRRRGGRGGVGGLALHRAGEEPPPAAVPGEAQRLAEHVGRAASAPRWNH